MLSPLPEFPGRYTSVMSESESVGQSAGTTPSADGASPPAGRDRRPSWFETLARLWCLQTIPTEPRGSPAGAIVLLSISWLVAWILIDRWQRQPDPEFYAGGIPLLAWYALALLGLAGLLRAHIEAAADVGRHPGTGTRPDAGAHCSGVGCRLLLRAVLVRVGMLCRGGLRIGVLAAGIARGHRPVPACRGSDGRHLYRGFHSWLSDATDAIPDVWSPREAASAVATTDWPNASRRCSSKRVESTRRSMPSTVMHRRIPMRSSSALPVSVNRKSSRRRSSWRPARWVNVSAADEQAGVLDQRRARSADALRLPACPDWPMRCKGSPRTWTWTTTYCSWPSPRMARPIPPSRYRIPQIPLRRSHARALPTRCRPPASSGA